AGAQRAAHDDAAVQGPRRIPGLARHPRRPAAARLAEGGRARGGTSAGSPAELRAAARRGAWTGTTAGHCAGFQQANLVILPQSAAAEFAAFCTRNPTSCPLVETTPPGDPVPAFSAPGADLRTDVP